MQKWTHHLHEKPTQNPLDPHKSQQPLSSRSQQKIRPERHDLESFDVMDSQDDGRMRLDSMRDRIQEMETQHDSYYDHESSHHDANMDINGDNQEYGDDNGVEEDDVDITELLHVVDAFQMPRWAWSSDVKTFTRVDPAMKQQNLQYESHSNTPGHQTSTNQVLGMAEEKTAMFRARYQILLQRIMRNECFAPPVFTGGMEQDRYLKLTPLKALKGRCGERFLMFGMLVQMSSGKYSLEDADDRIELVLDHSVSLFPELDSGKDTHKTSRILM
jgi:hypothetical protein